MDDRDKMFLFFLMSVMISSAILNLQIIFFGTMGTTLLLLILIQHFELKKSEIKKKVSDEQ